MRLSDHEINSALRERLQMQTGRHLYAVLGTYGALERYERASYPEAKRPQSVRQRLAEELDRLLVESLAASPLVALKQLELVFAYDLELNSLRTRGVNRKHILLMLPGQRSGDRITLFHEASPACHRTLPANLVPENHLWELAG